jgi:DNA polymerase-3 subunit delta'
MEVPNVSLIRMKRNPDYLLASRLALAAFVPMLDLVGHVTLRARLSAAARRGALPASLLLHGPAGTGKERLGLWLATLLLCNAPTPDGSPCGACQQCRFAATGAHPDLHWYFPRPRLKDSDPDVDDVVADLAEAIADRVAAQGAWPQPAPNDSLFVATVRALVRRASMTPSIAKRKVIVVADAERMVPQEGSDMAANAFLKLLEEPLADTTIILTTSAPAALLPTIRSRVVAVRVPQLTTDEKRALAAAGVERDASDSKANRAASAMLSAALSADPAERYREALAQGTTGARGAYSETLDALTALLHERARTATSRGDEPGAAAAAHGVGMVENAKRLARQNVNPQLVTAGLLADLAALHSTNA